MLRLPEVNYLVNQQSPIDILNNRYGMINRDNPRHPTNAYTVDEAAQLGFKIAVQQDECPLDPNDGEDILWNKNPQYLKAMNQIVDESAIESKVFRECKTAQFLNNPSLYSSQRTAALSAINQDCYNDLDSKMFDLYELGMPLSKAKQQGKEVRLCHSAGYNNQGYYIN